MPSDDDDNDGDDIESVNFHPGGVSSHAVHCVCPAGQEAAGDCDLVTELPVSLRPQ